MGNRRVGKIGAITTGLAVLAFALSMLAGVVFNVDTVFWSCLASMFIALGYLPFAVGLAATGNEKSKAAGWASVAFGAVYAVIILLVYYAECTTVRMNPALGEEALSIISYAHLGSLFFNYDLLGYGLMGLSTFFASFTIVPGGCRVLRMMLRIHGVFFLFCFFMPMFPVFTADTQPIIGTIILEIWCLYFLPVCVLGYRYFNALEAA